MKRHKKTIVRALLTWLLLSLGVVGLSMGLASYWIITASVEGSIEDRADHLAAALGDHLAEYIWTLDDARLREHFRDHAREIPELARISILTEFEDPIFAQHFDAEPDPITCRCPVLRDGKTIGYVDVALTRKGVADAQRIIVRSSFLLILGGAITLFLMTTFLMRTLLARPLDRLAREIRGIADGDYTRQLPQGKHREIDIINREVTAMGRQIADRTQQLKGEIHERKEAEQALEALRDRLEVQVTERTLALQRAYEDLDKETLERRQIQNEMLEIARREQQRIGRDLHDALGQQLAGASFLLAALEKRLRDRELPESDLASEVGGHLREAVSRTRHIAYGLAPTEISDEGLIDGFEALAEHSQAMFDMQCEFTCTPGCHVRDSTVATHLYRIAQEALHNAASHGKAQHVWISLAVDQNQGVLTVRDDGIGLQAPPSDRPGMGLRIMKFRADTIGGTFTLSPNESGGTTITVTFKDHPPE
jgi:signal transduction histidine kinase